MNHPRTGAFWRSAFAFLVAPALFALAACGDDPVAPQDPTTVTFAPALGVDLSQMELRDGVYLRTLTPGVGDSITTGSMDLEYQLWLADGTRIDSGGFELDLDLPGVIPGFYIGVFGMRDEEVRQIVVPPDLGYGTQGRPENGIPGGAVLVFEVESLGVPGDTTDTTTTAVTAPSSRPAVSLF